MIPPKSGEAQQKSGEGDQNHGEERKNQQNSLPDPSPELKKPTKAQSQKLPLRSPDRMKKAVKFHDSRETIAPTSPLKQTNDPAATDHQPPTSGTIITSKKKSNIRKGETNQHEA